MQGRNEQQDGADPSVTDGSLIQRSEDEYREEPYRFVVLGVYLLAALANSLPTTTFSAINSAVEKQFGLTVMEVTLNSLFFPIGHTLFVYPCNYLINRTSTAFVYRFAAALIIMGVWLRTLLRPHQPALCLLGSFLCAVGNIAVLNTPTKVPLSWFAHQKVTLISSVCVLTNLVSMALGIALPGLFISSKSTQHDITALLRLEAIVVTVPFVLLALLARDRPTRPPSKSARALTAQRNYFQQVKKLIANRNYLKLVLSFTCGYGITIANFGLLNQILVGYGYPEPSHILTVNSLAALLMGSTGTFVVSKLIKKQRAIKKIAVLASLALTVGSAITIVVYSTATTNWAVLVPGCLLFGSAFIVNPTVYALFGSEIAFPLEQASVFGYMLACAQLFGFLMGLVFTAILDKTRKTSLIVSLVGLGMLLASTVILSRVEEDMRRRKYEEEKLLEGQPSSQSTNQETPYIS